MIETTASPEELLFNFQQGIVLAFDKPLEWSSFGIVSRTRKLLTEKMAGAKIKVGHAGTLDPLASGVIILTTGRATRLIDELQTGVKEYVATLQLGATTPSYDMEHAVDATFATEHITPERIAEVVPSFIGEIMQIPPVFSAVKIQGQRAYDLARKGQDVELRAKPLNIDEIEIIAFDTQHMQLTLRIVCSKGTYIRALARDIGQALDSGAYLTYLRRTRVGQFSLADCFTLDTFEDWLTTHNIATTLLDNQSLKKQRAAVRKLTSQSPNTPQRL